MIPAQHGEKTEVVGRSTWRWLVLAAVLCLGEVGIASALGWLSASRTLDGPIVAWLWGLGTIVICGLAILLAPATTSSRLLSLAWFGPAALLVLVTSWRLMELGVGQRGMGLTARIDDGAQALLYLVLYGLSATLVAGGWISLRGRRGMVYLSLIAAPLINAVLVIWFTPTGWSGQLMGFSTALTGKLGPLLGVDLRTMRGEVLLGFPTLYAVLAVVAVAWIAAIPALNRAEATRRARAFSLREQRARQVASAPQAGTGAPVPAAVGTNPFAITSLVLGIIGGSVLAIVFGHVARGQNKRTGQGGSGMALAGLILGYVQVAALIVWIIVVMVVLAQYR